MKVKEVPWRKQSKLLSTLQFKALSVTHGMALIFILTLVAGLLSRSFLSSFFFDLISVLSSWQVATNEK